MLCGPSQANAVTTLASAGKPRSTCSGSHGFARLVLGHAVGDLGRGALGGAVAGAGQPAADVHEHQPHRAADGDVGAEALAEAL